eukprot:gene21238-28154_t
MALKQVADSDDEDDLDDEDWGNMYDATEEVIAPEDEKALEAFMAPGAKDFKQLSLGDLILSKLREKQEEAGMQPLPEAGEEPLPEGLDDKVVEVYRGVGKLLSRYSSGKVPKAFKIIPNLKNWEEVLYLTDPDKWSPQAMAEATKMFVSNMNARLAQRFLALVLLPRIRRDIQKHHKLHFELFMALKKATYKPGAFFKGLVLPLCQSRTCTLREAFIFSSVLKKVSIPVLHSAADLVSIPVLHSAAALMRMAELEYCGTTSFFIRTLLDKKYALPYRTIDALVDHFIRFADDEREMPVVTPEVVREIDNSRYPGYGPAPVSSEVTPEVVREIDNSRNRGSGAAPMALESGSAAPRQSGAAAMFAQTLIGKNVVENTNIKSLPPVLLMEED